MKNSKKKSSFRGKVATDAKKQTQSASSYGYLKLPSGVSVFSPKPGERYTLDFMPYIVSDKKHPDRDKEIEKAIEGSLWYKRPFMIHVNVGAGNERCVCLQSIGKPCPICEARTKMQKKGASKEELDELRPRKRNLYVVVPLKTKDFKQEMHIWDSSQFLFQNLLNKELDENSEFEIFPDLEEGLSLKIRFDSSTVGKGDPFAEASRIDFIERDGSYDESTLDDVPDLDKVLSILSYEELEAKFLEYEQEDDDEDEEIDDRPAKKSSKSMKKNVKEEEEEENDDNEEDEDPDENDDDSLSWSDLEGLNFYKLGKLVKELKLTKKIIVADYDDDPEALRIAIAEELEIEIPKKGKSSKSTKTEKQTSKPSKKYVDEEEDDEDEDEDDDDPEEEEEKPVKKSAKRTSKPSSGKCPSGHTFGKDTGRFEECEDCDLFDECLEAKNKKK